MHSGVRIEIRGVVQGVGMRPWVYRLAREVGVNGRVRNDSSGVTIDAFGPERLLESFEARLRAEPPPAAVFESFIRSRIPHEEMAGFEIVASREDEQPRVSIPPDLATCPECLAEVRDPSDRRHRYPFTNCTHCGPRFTIARDIPYDRPATSMAAFRMCPDCQREYDSPADRRFHAQPNACPCCGPRLWAAAPSGAPLEEETEDALRLAARMLVEGKVVAIKGIGGFHLACDATSQEAVTRLRERKRREEKPFAVMVRDLAAAEALVHLTEPERLLLESAERPIVLVQGRGEVLAPAVAPDTSLVGVMLPYSPLHHLLLSEVGRPLVMTSGNLSDEPIAFRNDDALRRLRDVADLLLLHDREIVTRADDSVCRLIAGRPVVLRRSRGYAPRGVPVRRPFVQAVLGCGAHLKNTFCIGTGDAAYLGPHVGDLDELETFHSYEESIERMERFLRVRPEVIAHDLHPDYLSTRYARQRSGGLKLAVQHHHAHVASAMAEHGLEGPVLGFAYDGTGLGTDGTAWGAELLLARYDGFERVATFRPLKLPGGERAIREVWRVALALLDDAFEGRPPLDRLPLFSSVSAREVDLVRRMARQGINSPLARGLGRYFDALGALVLGRPVARYEGQVAMSWNMVAAPGEAGSYPYEIDLGQSPWTVDLRPLVRAAMEELLAGVPAGLISARFHNALCDVSAELARRALRAYGRVPVVLTGGCFQNPLLVEGLLRRLEPHAGVCPHARVPPGDGGIALGQALIADAVARRQ